MRSRSTVSTALSRKTSVVRRITGGSSPPANPARRARSASFPLTASIQSPASRITSRIFRLEFAFMAYRPWAPVPFRASANPATEAERASPS